MEEFLQGILYTFAVTFTAEIGDKTFILLAVLASKQPITALLIGNQLGLTPIIIGVAYLGGFVAYFPTLYVNCLACLCFAIFASLVFYESYSEYKKPKKGEDSSDCDDEKLEPLLTQHTWLLLMLKTAIAIFLAELGDISQWAIFSLSLVFPPESVIIGASMAMLVCGLIAVLIGKIIGKYISEVYTSFISGVIFLAFAGYSGYLVVIELLS